MNTSKFTELTLTKLIALLLIISTPAYAGNAITVKTGDIVPPAFNEGTLLDKEQAGKIKDQLIERDGFEKENKSYQKSIELYKANETIYQSQNEILLNRNIKLSESLNSSRSTSTWEVIGYMALGALTLYGGSRLTR